MLSGEEELTMMMVVARVVMVEGGDTWPLSIPNQRKSVAASWPEYSLGREKVTWMRGVQSLTQLTAPDSAAATGYRIQHGEQTSRDWIKNTFSVV